MPNSIKPHKCPRLSVIVANYNNGRYLSDCLDSILNQSFTDYEIIIGDDCSTDNSRDLIENYQNKYPEKIIPIFNKKNFGVSANRHNAILASRGEYLTTLDSDDFFFTEDKLKNEMRLIDSYLSETNKDIIAFSKTVHVSAAGDVLAKNNTKGIKQGDILTSILPRSIDIPRDFIFKKSMYFDVGGYNKALYIYEDWDLKIRLASKYPFFFTFSEGTAYRRNIGSGLSSLNTGKHLYWLWVIFNSNIHLVPATDRFRVYNRFFVCLLNVLVWSIKKTKLS